MPPPTHRNYSFKFALRTGPELHQALALKALQADESLNSYLVKKLTSFIRDGD